MIRQLSTADKAAIALADPNAVINALGRLRAQGCPPPWLRGSNPYPDGGLPTDKAGFAAVVPSDLLEVIAVRGPLHVMDGWSYLGQAFSALLSGQAHVARHLSYYAELRAALSILASSGIGVFNKRNAVIDASGSAHILSEMGTHEMAWHALSEWATASSRVERLVRPMRLVGISLLDSFREFFPAQILTSGGDLMYQWGLDLRQGAEDKDQRNWSSYQPTALLPLPTSPADDAAFVNMFWNVCRPHGGELERHLLRKLLEQEALTHNAFMVDYEVCYQNLPESVKNAFSFDFLTRIDDAVDHDFMLHLANNSSPAPPYAMICRAGLLLKLATGMAEENLRAAGITPALHFGAWWQDFGAQKGLWHPNQPPDTTADLMADIDIALEDNAAAPKAHRHGWMLALGGSAMTMCETERAGLWGLFP